MISSETGESTATVGGAQRASLPYFVGYGTVQTNVLRALTLGAIFYQGEGNDTWFVAGSDLHPELVLRANPENHISNPPEGGGGGVASETIASVPSTSSTEVVDTGEPLQGALPIVVPVILWKDIRNQLPDKAALQSQDDSNLLATVAKCAIYRVSNRIEIPQKLAEYYPVIYQFLVDASRRVGQTLVPGETSVQQSKYEPFWSLDTDLRKNYRKELPAAAQNEVMNVYLAFGALHKTPHIFKQDKNQVRRTVQGSVMSGKIQAMELYLQLNGHSFPSQAGLWKKADLSTARVDQYGKAMFGEAAWKSLREALRVLLVYQTKSNLSQPISREKRESAEAWLRLAEANFGADSKELLRDLFRKYARTPTAQQIKDLKLKDNQKLEFQSRPLVSEDKNGMTDVERQISVNINAALRTMDAYVCAPQDSFVDLVAMKQVLLSGLNRLYDWIVPLNAQAADEKRLVRGRAMELAKEALAGVTREVGPITPNQDDWSAARKEILSKVENGVNAHSVRFLASVNQMARAKFVSLDEVAQEMTKERWLTVVVGVFDGSYEPYDRNKVVQERWREAYEKPPARQRSRSRSRRPAAPKLLPVADSKGSVSGGA